MLQHPLLPLTGAYIAGVAVAAHLPLPLTPVFIAAFSVAALALSRPQARGWLMLALSFLAGFTNLAACTAVLSPHDLRRLVDAEPILAKLRGRLVETPTLRARGEGDWDTVRSLAVVEVEAIQAPSEWQPAAGRVAVGTPAALPEGFYRGQRVEVYGVLQRPRSPRAPGLFDAEQHFRWLGIHHQLEAQGTNDWRLGPGALPVHCLPVSDRFMAWARRALARGLPEEDEALRLMWAMALGWRTALTDEVAAPFMQSGTMHVFAISGLHVALLAQVLVAVLRVCRVPRRVAGWLVLPLLWAYAGVTGWQASALRATVMMSVVIGGWALARPGNLLNSLAGAGLGLLVWDPRQLFQAGFQLSFFVVLSMAVLLPVLRRGQNWLLAPDPLLPAALRPVWHRRLEVPLRWLTLNLGISLSAWLGSLPLIAHYFHLFTPVSLLANILVVPLSGLVLVCNLASLGCAAWLAWAGELFNHAGWFWMFVMVRVSEWCARIPGGFWWVGDPGLAGMGFYYGLLGGVVIGRRLPPGAKWGGAAGLLLMLGLALAPALARRGGAEVFVLPTGNGHAVWVDAPGWREDLLVDCGDLVAAARMVVPFLHARGLNHLPHLALTHGDVRHVGGAPCLESNLPPAHVWASHVPFRSPGYRAYLESLEHQSGRRQWTATGDRLAGWDVLHPGRTAKFSLADDNALVLRRSLGGVRWLLLSDLGQAGEAELLKTGVELRAEIVVTGVPGRGRPLGLELLEAVRPRLIVVADDEPGGPGRASPEQRRHLLAAGVPTIFTSDEGHVTLQVRSGGWSYRCRSGLNGCGEAGPGGTVSQPSAWRLTTGRCAGRVLDPKPCALALNPVGRASRRAGSRSGGQRLGRSLALPSPGSWLACRRRWCARAR